VTTSVDAVPGIHGGVGQARAAALIALSRQSALITGAPKGIGTATRQRIGRGRGVGRSHLRLRPEQRRSCVHGDHRLRRGRR